MKKILFAFIILVLIGGQSNSYAADLPIKYNGVAYWGESHTQYTFPSDPRIGIPLPTEFSEGVVEDVLGQYRYLGTWLSPSFHVADECLGYYASGSCWRYTYHWAVTRSIDCHAPLLPNYDYTQCVVAPPAEQYFVSTNDLDKPLPIDPQSCSNEESNNSSPVTTAGNPIDTKDGNKSRTETDYTQSGISPLEFTRYYNSNKKRKTDVGVNWRHTYNTTLTENIRSQSIIFNPNDASQSSQYGSAQEACESGWSQIKSQFAEPEIAQANAIFEIASGTCNISSGGSIGVRQANTFLVNPPQDTIIIERANGNTIVFTSINSVWTAPSGSDVSLVQTASGYTLTTAQDTIEEYDLEGKLVSTTDRKGMQQLLSYNATTGLLESVTDSLGKSLSFSYTGSNLTSVTLPDATQLTYTYDAKNNFSSVKREDNSDKTYVYEDARFPNALTGIIDENQSRYMTFSYDTQGRAITSELGDGVNLSAEKVTVKYIDDVTSTVTDALGQLRTYRFTTINGEKRLTDIEGAPCGSCGGQSTHTTYDANGYVASSTDFNGNVTTFINNARGLATTRTEATGTANERVTTTVWHATYPLPLKITQAGNVTDLTYDVNGNVLTRTQTDTTNNKTRAWTYTYNNYGQVLSVDGARTDVNDLTTYAYDSHANLVTVTNALGHVTQITAYDARNRPLTLIDANGLITQLAYDVRGRLLTRTVTGDGTSLTTTFSYDNVGNLISINLPDGRRLNYRYDAAQRLIGISDQLGNRIDYTLDALGNHLTEKVSDATNTLVRARTQVFNMLSQLTQSIGAQTQTTSYGYDANGNRIATTDAASQTTTSAFDALNRVISVTDPLTGISTYHYDVQGNLGAVKDTNGSTTSYTYDGFANRTSQSSPDTGTTSYQYDTAANIISTTDAKAQTTSYVYDVLNRLTQTTYSDGRVETYTYDQGVNAMGRLSQIQNTATVGGSSTISYGYDVFGRITTKVQTVNGLNLSTAYAYNAQGRLSQITYPSGSVVAYSYLNGELKSISVDNQPLISDISYQAFGSVSGWIWGNGSVSSRGFDLDGQLITQTLANDIRTLGYDSLGNIKTITSNTTNQLFDYDALNRLTAANDSALNSSFNQAFTYDANSNRLSLTNGLAIDDYTYENMSNRLLSLSGSTIKTYQYDLNGNSLNDGLNAYVYDSRNRLVTATYPQACPADEKALCGTNTDDANYQFNALGQRVSKKVNNNVPDYSVLTSHYQQVADAARLQATTYSEQATSLLSEALNNETLAQSLNDQAILDRAQAQALYEEANLVETDQQATQRVANDLYASAAAYQALIIEPTTSLYQGLLNSIYQAIVDLLTVTADAVQAYANYLAQQVVDLRQQADTLIATATTAEQQAASLLTTAAQNKLDAANLQTLAAEQTTLADAAQIKADNYQALALNQPRALTETVYTYDEAGQLIGEYDAAGNATQEFIYLGNLPIGLVSNNVLYYIHADHLGTPREITDANNTTVWSWFSDPFGKTAANEDPDNDGISFTFNLRFAGQYYDSETGLHYNYFRDYDPSTGRYVQSDPIGLAGGLNTYGYVGGNPLYWSDPLGLHYWGAPTGAGQINSTKGPSAISINAINALTKIAKRSGIGIVASIIAGIMYNEDASDEEGRTCPVSGGEHDTTNGLGTDFWDAPGSYDDAVDAANDLTGGNLEDKGNGIHVGTDSNGNTIIVRPGGGGKFRGNPANGTIEIQPSGGGEATDKIRYR